MKSILPSTAQNLAGPGDKMIRVLILSFVIFEAFFWTYTIWHHAKWLEQLPVKIVPAHVSTKMLKIAAFNTAVMLVACGAFGVMIDRDVCGMKLSILANIVAFGFPLAVIHTFALLGRFSCLPLSFWPLPSKLASRVLRNKFNIPEPLASSADVRKCYQKKVDLSEVAMKAQAGPKKRQARAKDKWHVGDAPV